MTEETAEPGTLKAYITGSMRKKREAKVERIPIPRFGGRIVLRCHAIGDRDLLRVSMLTEKNPDEVGGLIDASIAALLAACDGVETDQVKEADGQPVDLGVHLGLELAQYLGTDADCGAAATDEEAVVEIFASEKDIVLAANDLEQFAELAGVEVENETVGNSEAAG